MGRVRALKTWFERRGWLLGVLFVALALAIQLAVHVYPIFYSVYRSLTEWNMLQPVKRFVGLSNYQQLFTSGDFWHMVQHTAYYSFSTVFLTLPGGSAERAQGAVRGGGSGGHAEVAPVLDHHGADAQPHALLPGGRLSPGDFPILRHP